MCKIICIYVKLVRFGLNRKFSLSTWEPNGTTWFLKNWTQPKSSFYLIKPNPYGSSWVAWILRVTGFFVYPYFEFHPYLCFIMDQVTGKILLQGTIHDGLYSFKLTTSSPNSKSNSIINHVLQTTTFLFNTNISECNSHIDIWHKRLGHISSTVIDKVLAIVHQTFQ